MVLITIFMVGYYVLNSPSQRVTEHETEYAINKSDLRSVAECAAAQHNANIKGTLFQDICTQQNEIASDVICLDIAGNIVKCDAVRKQKPEESYIITTTRNIPDTSYNKMMEILETDFSDAGTFGIFTDGMIVSGAGGAKRTVPKDVITKLNLTNGQLVYLTQYEEPEITDDAAVTDSNDVICPTGTIKTYRFGRWQCTGYNTKTDCGGDTIWDSELMECVADESRKPLCAQQQTAVLVDSVWECVNPFPTKTCPEHMIARLNYTTLEWECVTDPNYLTETKKCDNVTHAAVYGAIGATVRVPSTSCTDCEKMITNTETCESACVPDVTKINDANCYPGDINECSGSSRAVYFGFPNAQYASQIAELNGTYIPFDAQHSQNRKFNCLDCGVMGVDNERSQPPFVAICK